MTLRFDRRPFRTAPSPELSVAAPTQEAALAQLRYALDSGPTLLDGDPGVGKTTVALKLLVELAPSATPIYLPGCKYERPAALHQAILFDLSRPHEGKSESELRLAVHEALLNEKQRAILVLDDAHDLSDEALEELRGFDNLAVRGGDAVSILLVAANSLRERLAKPELAAVTSRLGMRVRVDRFNVKDAVNFVRDQITSCGGSSESFSDEAIEMIVSQGQGIPRMINRLASLALAIASESGEESVDVEAVLEAQARLDMPAEPAHLSLKAESKPAAAGRAAAARDAAAGRTPKQKARKRSAA